MQVKSEPQTTNQCFTCLCPWEDCMQISSDAIDSDSVTVVDVLTKHFWFQRDEFTGTQQYVICRNCWTRLGDFHRFYQQVENNHRHLNRKPLEACDRTDGSDGIVQLHSEIEIKAEDSWHQSEDVESDDGDSTATPSNEKQNEKPKESRSSDQTGTVAKAKRKSGKARAGRHADQIISTHSQFICTFCGENCSTFHRFKAHIEKAHQTEATVTCCGEQYSTRVALLEHVLKLENPNSFRCDICGKMLANNKSVRRHKQEVHVTEEARKKYQCDQCPKQFVRARALAQHAKQHAIEKTYGAKSNKCPHCQKRFRNIRSTTKHIKLYHVHGENNCDDCGKSFVSKWNLGRHKKLQHESSLEEQRAQCSICLKWFRTKYSLYMHSLTHTAPKECDICGIVLEHHRALSIHKREDHKTEKCSNSSEQSE